jgi:hypothetical protein
VGDNFVVIQPHKVRKCPACIYTDTHHAADAIATGRQN